MGKLKTYWPEIFFFLFTLVLGWISHWGKSNIGQWGINSAYLGPTGEPMISRTWMNSPNLIFTFFWIGTIFAYLLSLEVFRSRRWSFLVTLIFYFTPVLPGLAFWDVHSSPMVCFAMVGLFILVHFVKHPTILFAILLALVNGLAIFTHPMMMMIPAATFGFILLNVLTRNIEVKALWKLLAYVVIILGIILYFILVLDYWHYNIYRDYLPSLWIPKWQNRFNWYFMVIPPLWIVYFIFSILALNMVYFSNYFAFLKNKWIYTYLFVLLLLFHLAPFVFPHHPLLYHDRNVYSLPSIILIGVGGCYEFSIWVRKRWGERVYFIFKYTFLAIFILQCLWALVAMVWLYPEIYLYRNWPLFFIM